MSIVQWLLLLLIIVVVAGAYWYLRHQAGSDPWKGMEEPDDNDDPVTSGEAMSGDSYIVGVRTIPNPTPAGRRQQSGEQAPGGGETREPAGTDATEDASWQTFKRPEPEQAEASQAQPAPAEAPAQARPQPQSQPEAAVPQYEAADTGRGPGAPDARMDNIQPFRMPGSEPEIFVLYVASPDGRSFDGPDIHAALQARELKFGLNDIYHRVTETHGVPQSVFAVANMLKPGTLDPVEQDHLATPGLAFFLMVPGPLDGGPAMRDMMETANGIAQALGGEVLDDKRALLKAQTAQYMLDQIAELDRRARLAARR